MRILFDAPIDFDESLVREYEGLGSVVWAPYSSIGYNIASFPPRVAQVWVCNPKADFIINDDVLESFSHLKIIATPSTGTNHIDLAACERRGIKVISLLDDREGLNTISASAEFTFKLILDVLRLGTPRELNGKMLGLIGYGRIGQWIFKRLDGTGVMVHDPLVKTNLSIETIFRNCDIIVVCCTYSESTHHMITEQHILSMKPQARLVNTARGEVIDEEGMKRALEQRPDIRVALDVLEGETTGTANPDWFLERGHIVTPHTAGATFDSRTKAAKIILNLLKKEMQWSSSPVSSVVV
jgi:D-3-phosphoglycerate dehydrogenase / 2-oxoglutarate reductase